MSSQISAPNKMPRHVLEAIEKAEALGQPKVAEAIKRAELLRQQRVAQSAERRRLKDRIRKKAQRDEQKRRKTGDESSECSIDEGMRKDACLSAASESRSTTAPSKFLASASNTKTSTSSLPALDTDQISTTKTGCYLALPEFDEGYFCGWCNCALTTSWHYRLIPAIFAVPMIQMLTNEDNSNIDEESARDTCAVTKTDTDTLAVTSTPFKSIADSSPPTQPAVVTPPEKTAAKSSRSSVCNENGADAITRLADKIVAQQFNSADPRAVVFGQEVSRPLGDRKLSGKVALSWYPPKYLPVFGDGSGTKRMRKKDIVGPSNHIIQVGKNIMKQSEWNVNEAEANVFGSSTKYHTLLVHDPNIAAREKSGLSIIYFMPVATKYFWLSFITTAMNARRDKKEERGRGYGRMILWRLINLARMANGIEEIYLEVNPVWTSAFDLYQSLGFEEISWDILPEDIEAFEFKVKADDNPECKKMEYEPLFKHYGEYTLMRLELSVFG